MAASFFTLGAGGPVPSGTVTGRGAAQSVTFLRRLAGLPDAKVIVPEPGPRTVLSGQHADDVHMIRSVPDRDPANRIVVLAMGCESGPVHDVARQFGPLVVGQQPVPRRGPHHAVPYRLAQAARPQRRVWLA